MDYFSCDPHHHQLPCYILPFLAVWSLLLQITVSVIGKVISEISKTETASVAHSVLLYIFFCSTPLFATCRASLAAANAPF